MKEILNSFNNDLNHEQAHKANFLLYSFNHGTLQAIRVWFKSRMFEISITIIINMKIKY